MNRILPKIWIAYLVLLPLNLTYFLGAGPALPADLALLPLLALGFPSLRRNLWAIVRSDYPVALYFLLFAVSAVTAAAAHGLSRSLLTALAAQGSLAALYFVFRATVIEKRLIFRLALVWVTVSTVAAARRGACCSAIRWAWRSMRPWPVTWWWDSTWMC